MESPLLNFKDFSDINDFDFMYNGNDIMVNEAATNLSKVDEGVELPPPLATTNEQTQLDPMNVDLNTFREEELLLKDGVYAAQPVYSEVRVKSVQANQLNIHIGSSLAEDRAHKTQSDYSERRVNLVKANNLNGHIGSSLLEDGVYTAKLVYLECRVNSLQEKTLNGHVGSSLQDELLRYVLDCFLNCLMKYYCTNTEYFSTIY
ncbi:hypothetical protein Godav_011662 [Gossypium davidsonii]|uniref:Uncharacterized protein n=1 Tax=Gossypium davidsonii TaxID=34287 RepID=A0A7J8RAW3_GOSDV|nr:hypothetical protein [Gossypium davidsonii]